jgi:hypothetical protein
MANPFTSFLSSDLDDESLITFIGYWDRLEMLVVSVYRNDAAGSEDEREFEQVRSWLSKNYSSWQNLLQPYWRQSRTGRQLTREDPFARLLATPSAADFVGDWTTMQDLPAAREALNRFVLDQLSK